MQKQILFGTIFINIQAITLYYTYVQCLPNIILHVKKLNQYYDYSFFFFNFI